MKVIGAVIALERKSFISLPLYYAVDILEEAVAQQGYAGGGYKFNNPLNVSGNLSIQLTAERWENLNSSYPAAFAVYIDVKAGSELLLDVGGFSLKLMPTSKGQRILLQLSRNQNYYVEYDSTFNYAYDTIGISLKGSVLEFYMNCALLKNISLVEQQTPTLLSTDIHLSGPALVCCNPCVFDCLMYIRIQISTINV